MSFHSVTHEHVYGDVPGGQLKACRWRLPWAKATFGFKPDLSDRAPWYWVPADMVPAVAQAENAFAAVALLRARYRNIAERLTA
jgi:hypothetical protein